MDGVFDALKSMKMHHPKTYRNKDSSALSVTAEKLSIDVANETN